MSDYRNKVRSIFGVHIRLFSQHDITDVQKTLLPVTLKY